jgi:tRNA(Ile)-lysidine synthase TilS/MesJ
VLEVKQYLFYEGRILIAVSGGPDSVMSLDVVHGLKDKLKLYLEVASKSLISRTDLR